MTLKDDDTFGRRLKRYTKVSLSAGKIAAQLAGDRYLGTSADPSKRAKQFMESLGDLKGPVMKIAQLLATIPDFLPDEYVTELLQLQANAPAMGWLFVKRRMRTELGLEWESKFKSFEKPAAAAASLGQVHRATSLEGKSLACKLQYPDMSSAVEADLKQFKIVLALYEQTNKAVLTKGVFQEIAERLREELDYELEAKHIALYTKILQPKPQVHLPIVHPELSTKRLLTMDWLEGRPLLEMRKASQELRNTIATNMFYAWYLPFYHYSIIHGDPHLGNYTIRDNGDINLMDFGCIRIFTPSFTQGVIDLYYALLNNDQDLAIRAYETWGFQNISKDLISILNRWAKFLYGPLLEDKVQFLDESNSSIAGQKIAGEIHQELRNIGGVAPPPEFVFMDRAAVGLGSVFMHLKAKLNWYQLFHEMIDGFDEKIVGQRQEELIKKCDL